MITALQILAGWVALSIPACLFIGAFFKAGLGDPE